MNRVDTFLCEKFGQKVHLHAEKLKDVQYHLCVSKFKRHAMCESYQLRLWAWRDWLQNVTSL
jgi:hypothetical protein